MLTGRFSPEWRPELESSEYGALLRHIGIVGKRTKVEFPQSSHILGSQKKNDRVGPCILTEMVRLTSFICSFIPVFTSRPCFEVPGCL